MTIVSHPRISVLVHFELISEFRSVGIWIYLFHEIMFSYQSSLFVNLNHSIRMSDGQVMAKLQSYGLKTEQGKLPKHSSTWNAFMSPKVSEFGLDLFQGDMFSYQSSLTNLNHSIRMSDGQIMAKIQS